MAIMRYMGDQPLAKNQTEVDCVYAVLVVSVDTLQSLTHLSSLTHLLLVFFSSLSLT